MAQSVKIREGFFYRLEVNTEIPGAVVKKPLISGKGLWLVVVYITTENVFKKCLMFFVPTSYRVVTLKKVGSNFVLLNSFTA